MFEFFDAPMWIDYMFKDIWQLSIILAFIVLYRPRSAVVDEYMRRDEDVQDGERDEVRLEDLTHYSFSDNDNKKNWEEGERLPLEPVAVKSSEKPMKPGKDFAYTNITDDTE